MEPISHKLVLPGYFYKKEVRCFNSKLSIVICRSVYWSVGSGETVDLDVDTGVNIAIASDSAKLEPTASNPDVNGPGVRGAEEKIVLCLPPTGSGRLSSDSKSSTDGSPTL